MHGQTEFGMKVLENHIIVIRNKRLHKNFLIVMVFSVGLEGEDVLFWL